MQKMWQIAQNVRRQRLRDLSAKVRRSVGGSLFRLGPVWATHGRSGEEALQELYTGRGCRPDHYPFNGWVTADF